MKLLDTNQIVGSINRRVINFHSKKMKQYAKQTLGRKKNWTNEPFHSLASVVLIVTSPKADQKRQIRFSSVYYRAIKFGVKLLWQIGYELCSQKRFMPM